MPLRHHAQKRVMAEGIHYIREKTWQANSSARNVFLTYEHRLDERLKPIFSFIKVFRGPSDDIQTIHEVEERCRFSIAEGCQFVIWYIAVLQNELLQIVVVLRKLLYVLRKVARYVGTIRIKRGRFLLLRQA